MVSLVWTNPDDCQGYMWSISTWGWFQVEPQDMISGTRPGKRLQFANDGKIHHAIDGKTHYFYGHVQ